MLKPNFNFNIYLSSLALINVDNSALLDTLLSYIDIFMLGIIV